MARTVDTPIKLPRQWSAGGAEIKHTAPSADHGLLHVAKSQNSLWDQHRGQLVNDHEADSEASILSASAANNLRYRVPLIGSATVAESAVVGMWAYGNGGLGAAFVTVSDGTNSATLAAPTGSTGTVFAATNTMTLVSGAENADLTWTYTSGTVGVVVGTFAYYVRNRTTLPTAGSLQYYAGTTFGPQESSLYADNMPVTSAMGYALRDNAAELYSRVGPAIGCSWGASPLPASSSNGFVAPVPENVTTLRLFVDGIRVTTGGYSVTTPVEVKTGSFGVSRAFTSAIDLDVSGLSSAEVEISGTGDASTFGVSGYWMARSLPA
jgi:hypothetical protein